MRFSLQEVLTAQAPVVTAGGKPHQATRITIDETPALTPSITLESRHSASAFQHGDRVVVSFQGEEVCAGRVCRILSTETPQAS